MRIAILLVAALTATVALAHEPEREVVDTSPHLEQCQAAAAALGQALKARLQSAMTAGGPLGALTVCRDEADDIAAAVCDSMHLDVGRTSLKVRNPDNAPDPWEIVALEEFETRLAEGEPAEGLDTWFVSRDAEGRRHFRYLKAIPTAALCLNCHGAQIESSLQARLDELYPDDAATGFAEGDIRGAFTASKPLHD